MTHAELAKKGSDRIESYEFLLMGLKELLTQDNWVGNLANAASLVWHHFEGTGVNWAGFYYLKNDQLVLGPFHGKPACQVIKIGEGVCGTAAAENSPQVIPNVHEFPGHIACDGDTNSEIVIPISHNGKVLGVLDIDCIYNNGFDSIDEQNLVKVATLLAPSMATSLS